jgi:cytoskeletal protein CcmA (bactofilin family)
MCRRSATVWGIYKIMSKEERTRVSMHSDSTGSTGNSDSFDDMEKAEKKGGLLGKLNSKFQDAIQEGRSEDALRDVRSETADGRNVSADDLAIRRSKSVSNPQRMTVPEGVIIEGALTSSSETDVAGKIDGNVTVDGSLNLSASALITGTVRATTCTIQGLAEGKVECDDDLVLGKGGKISSDIMAGSRVVISGIVNGNVQCGGRLELSASAEVNGNIKARSVIIEPGAMFNGTCTMGGKGK